MWFRGQRKTLPSSRYADYLAIAEAYGWTYDDYLNAPAELVDEMRLRLRARALAEQQAIKKLETKHGRRC